MNNLPTVLNHPFQTQLAGDFKQNGYITAKNEKKELAFTIIASDILLHHSLTINHNRANISPIKAKKVLQFDYANKTISIGDSNLNYLLSNQKSKQTEHSYNSIILPFILCI